MENVGLAVNVNTDIIKKMLISIGQYLVMLHIYENKVTSLPQPLPTGGFRFVEGKICIYFLYEKIAG